nr:hypothetical protein CFP56_10218 [Quercus suber]
MIILVKLRLQLQVRLFPFLADVRRLELFPTPRKTPQNPSYSILNRHSDTTMGHFRETFHPDSFVSDLAMSYTGVKLVGSHSLAGCGFRVVGWECFMTMSGVMSCTSVACRVCSESELAPMWECYDCPFSNGDGEAGRAVRQRSLSMIWRCLVLASCYRMVG